MKFIMLNGMSGAGKSTVARTLHEYLPLSVMVPNYYVRMMISGYKDYRKESGEMMFKLTEGLLEKGLELGSNVIVDQKTHDNFEGESVVDDYIKIAKEKGAEVYEIILMVEKDEAEKRIRDRGFTSKSLLNEDNVKRNVDKFYENMKKFIESRNNPIIIDTTNLSKKEVFDEIKKVVNIK